MKKIPRPNECIECGSWVYAQDWRPKTTKGRATIQWKCLGCGRQFETIENLEDLLINVKSLPEPKIAYIRE